MLRFVTRFGVVLVWLLLTFGSATAQAPPDAGEGKTVAYPGAAEIIPRLSKLTEDATTARERIATLNDRAGFREPLAQARERQQSLHQRVEALGQVGNGGAERLLDLRSAFAEQRNLLGRLLDSVSAPITELDALRQTWTANKEFWQGWQASLKGGDLRLPLESFRKARALIDDILQEIARAYAPLLDLQSEVTDLQNANLQALNRVDARLKALRAETFRKTEPSFFNPNFYRQLDRGLWSTVLSGFQGFHALDAQYLQGQFWLLLLQLLLALSLGFFIRSHRHDPEVSPEWRFILKHPWATGVFVAVAGLSFLFPAPPALLRLLLSYLAVGSASLLVAGLLEDRRKIFVVFFLAGLFLAAQTLQALTFPAPLYRLFLALVTLVGIPLALWTGTRSRRASQGRSGPFVVALNLGCLVFCTVLAAQAGGYAVLASRLFEASLETVFLWLMTAMAMRLMRGAVEYLLDLPLLRRSRFVRRSGAELAGRLKEVFDIFVVGYAGFYLLVVWGLFDSVPQAWDRLMVLGFHWGETRISVQMVLLAGLVIYLSIVVSWVLRALLEWEVFPRKGLDRGVRDAIKKLLHYSLVFFGFLLAVSLAGIDLKSFAVLAGAFGIGIGFGLQNVVNNFVSGIILLFERPIKVGDMVVMDSEWGTVRKIGLRSTIVETFDQSEIIVPNSELVSQKVTNWTLSTKVARVVLPVGVAYGSQLDTVLKILLEVAREHPAGLEEPPPSAIFTGFGDSSLDFEVRLWIADIAERLQVRSELGQQIDRRFREAGVEIPFPQRDLHLRSVDQALLRTVAPGAEAGDAPPPAGPPAD